MASDINIFAQITTAAQFSDTALLEDLGNKYKMVLTFFPDPTHVASIKTNKSSMPVYIFTNPYFGWGDRFWGTEAEKNQAIQDYGLRDSSNDLIYYSGDGVTPLMDIRNEDWKDEFSTQVIKHVNIANADGVFLDTIEEALPLPAVVPVEPGGYTAEDWKTQTLDFLDHVLAEMGALDTLANSGTRGPQVALPIPNEDIRGRAIAGETIEAFGQAIPIDTDDATKLWYATQTVNNDLATLSTFYPTLIEVTGSMDTEELRIYALCSYLIQQNSNTFFYFTTASDHSTELVWRSEWEANIGDPLGAGTQDVSGIFYRDFTRGKVLVNPSPNSIGMTIENGFKNWDNEKVGSSITMPPYSGRLLVKGNKNLVGSYVTYSPGKW